MYTETVALEPDGELSRGKATKRARARDALPWAPICKPELTKSQGAANLSHDEIRFEKGNTNGPSHLGSLLTPLAFSY